MNRAERRRRGFQHVRAAEDAGLPALTVARAQRFLKRHPDHSAAWYTLGIALTTLIRYEMAEEAFTRAIAFCPQEKLQLPMTRLGYVFELRGDHQHAETWYREAIQTNPTDASGHIHLGAMLANQGRLDDAEFVHRDGTRCSEGRGDEAFLNLGLVLRAQGRFVEAIECFTRALELDPDYRVAKKALRDVRVAMKLLPADDA